MAKSYSHRWNGWRAPLKGGEIKDRPGECKPRSKRISCIALTRPTSGPAEPALWSR